MKNYRTWILLTALLSSPSLYASDSTWIPTTGGSRDWNDPDNWTGSGYPNAAGAVANINNDIEGNQTVRLRQDITIGKLNIGDEAAPFFTFSIGNQSGESFALTFDSDQAGVPAELVLSNTDTSGNYFDAPLKLSSDLVVDLKGEDGANRPRLFLRSPFDLGDKTLKFIGGVYGQGQVSVTTGGDFTGADGVIVNSSSSTFVLEGSKNFDGVVVANGLATASNQSTFTFTSGGFTNAANLIINGYIENSHDRRGGAAWVGQNSSTSTNPGQLLPYRRITLNGGYLRRGSMNATVGVANDWQQGLEWAEDTVDVLDFKSGYSYLSLAAGGNTLGTRLSIKSLERQPGASVYLFGINDVDKDLLADNVAEHLIGAGGAADTATRSVVPWMVVHGGGGSGHATPSGFATYDEKGFRSLNINTEYTSDINAGADYNVNTDAITLTQDRTINSLRFNSWSDKNIGNGMILTVASGGIFFVNGRSIGISGNAAAGTLNFGTAEGIVSMHGTGVATIGASITGTGGLTKMQTGTLILTSDNSGLSGMVHVSGGLLQIGDGTYAGNTGSGDVVVHAGAGLQISCDEAIDDCASLTLLNLGPDMYFGRVILDDGINETVKYLFCGDQPMNPGTYGSSESQAEYQDDRYFDGSGILTVTSSMDQSRRATLLLIH